MPPSTLASSRASGYRFLHLIFMQGITPASWPVVEQVGLWPGQVPPDFGQAAAAHHHLFQMNLFPHAAVFLEDSGLVGGETAAAAIRLLAELGVPQLETAVSGDHLAVFLWGLAHLCGAEADAREDGLEPVARQMQDRQQRLLREGLSGWVWPFLAAMVLQDDMFYRQIGSLTFDLIASHLAEAPRQPEAIRQPADDLLANEATDLRDIARFLLTPLHSGWFLSRETTERLAGRVDVPRGFGGREQTLVNLLRAAAQYDRLPAVLDELQQTLQRWADLYAGWASQQGHLVPVIEPWEQRLAQTHRLLTGMRQVV